MRVKNSHSSWLLCLALSLSMGDSNGSANSRQQRKKLNCGKVVENLGCGTIRVDLQSSDEWVNISRKGRDLPGNQVRIAIVIDPKNSGLSKDQKIILYGKGRRGVPIYGFGGEPSQFKGVTLEPVKNPDFSVQHNFGNEQLSVYQVKGRVPKSEQSRALVRFIKDRETILKRLSTKEEFDGLSDKLKKDLLEWSSLDNSNLVRSSFTSTRAIHPNLREFVGKMLKRISEIETGPDREGYSVVGKPNYEITVTQLHTGEILGGTVTVHITGAETPGQQSSFKSRTDAKKAGAKNFETMWQIRATYAQDMHELQTPYLDWAGG